MTDDPKVERKRALEDLLAKIEAPKITHDGAMFYAFGDNWLNCFDAYNGSLDAAIALHKAVLSEWCWSVDSMGQAMVWFPWVEGDAPSYAGFTSGEPTARSLLAAILKALIALDTK